MATELPERLCALLDRHITSVEQLELLLILQETPLQRFTPTDAARRVGTAAHSAKIRLDDLVAARLADEGGGTYTYAATGEADQAVVELRRFYSTHRVRIISRIFDKPPESVRSFADAFRLRKD